MNILISSAGRRSYLVKYFADSLSVEDKLVVANSNPISTSIASANISYILPEVFNNNYNSELISLCKKEAIDVIFPLHDLESYYLSTIKNVLEDIGVFVMAPDKNFAEVAIDKYKTFQFLSDLGVPTPKTYVSSEGCINNIHSGLISFPILIKPRYGFASQGITFVNSISELVCLEKYLKNNIDKKVFDFLNWNIENALVFQEVIKGEEYGVEIVNDFKGNYCGSMQKHKFAMRSGETDGAQIIYDVELENIAKSISGAVKCPGVIDIDLFETKGFYSVLEMNPRFGGQYPFSHSAGANIPEFMINKWKGLEAVLKLPEIGFKALKKIEILSIK